MVNIVKAEHLKMKRTFGKMIPLFAPCIILLIALLLTGGLGNAFPAGAWNWWYTIFLPSALAIACYLNVKKDKKIKYYGIFLLDTSKQKSWFGKVIYCSIGLLIANFTILLGTFIGGTIFGTTIPFWGGIAGALLLSLSYMWEVPLFLFLSAKFGMFASVFTSVILSVSGVITIADSNIWWAYPASIPIRLMCPVLGILPNGLPIPSGSELNDPSVILPGIILSLVWLAIFAIGTSIWFNRREEK